jgi:hypothetical protein
LKSWVIEFSGLDSIVSTEAAAAFAGALALEALGNAIAVSMAAQAAATAAAEASLSLRRFGDFGSMACCTFLEQDEVHCDGRV